MLVGQKSRPDRIAGAYTILLAAGGVLIEELTLHRRSRWVRFALPAALLLIGAALAPLALPILPPGPTASYAGTLGIVPQIERGKGKRSELPQWLADRFGWEEFVDDVEAIAATLEPGEHSRAMILVPTYGQAGAIELLGRGRALPPVYSTQNSYFHWGPPEETVEVAIVASYGEETLRVLFQEIELVRVHDCDWCMSWRDGMPLWLARGPKAPLREIWPELKHYE
jgi:hypothetical protein